jgi:hypothetical protein
MSLPLSAVGEPDYTVHTFIILLCRDQVFKVKIIMNGLTVYVSGCGNTRLYKVAVIFLCGCYDGVNDNIFSLTIHYHIPLSCFC